MHQLEERNEEKNSQKYEKRVKVTGTGKYMRRRSHRSHYKLAKSSGTWKRLKRDVEASSGDSKKIRKLLG